MELLIIYISSVFCVSLFLLNRNIQEELEQLNKKLYIAENKDSSVRLLNPYREDGRYV